MSWLASKGAALGAGGGEAVKVEGTPGFEEPKCSHSFPHWSPLVAS